MNLDEFIEKNPDVQDIIDRIDQSDKNFNSKIQELKNESESGTIHPSVRNGLPHDTACVSHYKVGEIWKENINREATFDIEVLKKQIESVLKKDPLSIRIKLVSKPADKKKTAPIINDYPVKDEEPKEEKRGLGEVEDLVEKKLQEFKEHNDDKTDASTLRFEILRRDFEIIRIKDNYERKILDINYQHENTVTELQNEIDDLEQENEELLAEIDEQKEGLGTLEQEFKDKQNPLNEKVIPAIINKAFKMFLMDSPKLVTGISGLSQDDLKAMWAEEGEETKKIEKKTDESDFEETTTVDEYAGIDPNVAQGTKELVKWFKTLTFEELKRVFLMLHAIQDEKGIIIPEHLSEVLGFCKKFIIKEEVTED